LWRIWVYVNISDCVEIVYIYLQSLSLNTFQLTDVRRKADMWKLLVHL
jgi:hypothetical protein